jgi:hypothetical protein
MTATAFPRTDIASARMSMSVMQAVHGGTCAVHLIDRRTGRTHRVNGSPLVLFTRRPDEAAAELLEGRDRSIWEARIEPLGASIRA